MGGIKDSDLEFTWVYFGMHLQVHHKGDMVYNSVTNKHSSELSVQQVERIQAEYEKKRMKYVFNDVQAPTTIAVDEQA